MKLELSRQGLEKYSNVKFHGSLSSGNLVVQCGRTDGRTDGLKDITKLIVAFHNFANASTKDTANATRNVLLSSDDSHT